MKPVEYARKFLLPNSLFFQIKYLFIWLHWVLAVTYGIQFPGIKPPGYWLWLGLPSVSGTELGLFDGLVSLLSESYLKSKTYLSLSMAAVSRVPST